MQYVSFVPRWACRFGATRTHATDHIFTPRRDLPIPNALFSPYPPPLVSPVTSVVF